MNEVFSGIALLSALASVGLGFYAAVRIVVREDLEPFLSDLKRRTYWSAWAAFAAGVSTLAQVLQKLVN